MRLKYCIFIAIFFLKSHLFSQEKDTTYQQNVSADTILSHSKNYTISTDRPSASFTSFVVPKGILQLETVFFHQVTQFHTNQKNIDQTLPNLLLKYSPIKNFEIRFATDLYRNLSITDSIKTINTALNPSQVGFKLHLKKEEGLIPQITFLGSTYIGNLASKNLQFNGVNPYFRFAFQNTVSENFFVLYNFGMNFIQKQHLYQYTFLFGYLPKKHFTLFFEVFGNKSKELRGLDYLPHVGIIYIINNRYQLDATAGYLFARYQELDNLKMRLFFQLGFSTYLRLHS